MAMQSFLAGSMTLVSGTTRVYQFAPSTYVPSLQRNANFQVRSMAERCGLDLDESTLEELTDAYDLWQEVEQKESSPVTAPSPSPPPKPAPAAKVSTKFSDVLAFSGPAPERINGRLAMVGFVAAIGAELASGQDVFTQLSDGGVPWFLGTSILLSLASLIPLFKGVTVQSKSEGVMTSDAELWNGRFAMLGLVALVFTEYLKGGALV